MTTYYLPFGPEIALGQPFGARPGLYPNPAGGHNGDDWLTQVGVPVRAAGDGEVVFAGQFDDTYADNFGWNLNYGGNMVVLNMDGETAPYFEYGHLSDIYVKTGDRVRAGQIIAKSGASDGGTGVISGPHCHVGCLPYNYNLNSNTYGRVNPRLYMTAYWDDTNIQVQGTIIPPEEEEDEMYVIAKDQDKTGDAVWIGNGLHRRYIADPQTIEDLQKLARWGVLKLYKDGEVQTIAVEALGQDVSTSTASLVLNTEIPRGGRGAEIGAKTNLGAVVSWFDNSVISIIDTIQKVSKDSGVPVEEIIKGLSDQLANGIEIEVTASAKK